MESVPHQLDMLAVGGVLLRLAMHYRALAAHPPLLAHGAVVAGVNLLDTYLARQQGLRPLPHVVWHCAAAMFLHRVCTLVPL